MIQVELSENDAVWRYRIAFSADVGATKPYVKQEQVWVGDTLVLDRPNTQDRNDPDLLRQTYLEQTVVNRPFREIVDFFASIKYFHFVPQLVREAGGRKREDDPYGSDFIDQLTRIEILKRARNDYDQIQQALKGAIPSLLELKLERIQDVFHLRGRFRVQSAMAKSAWHNETDFSDGTLRLIGLLWALLDAQGPLLLEEPELSLHEAIVRHIPMSIWFSRNTRHGSAGIVKHA